MKLYGRSFKRSTEFPEGRHNFIGPPGYKSELDTLSQDVKAKTHEVLIKVFESETKLFLEVAGNKTHKRSMSTAHDEISKKKLKTSSSIQPPQKNMKKRSKAVRIEEKSLMSKLKSNEEVKRNEREISELAIFKSEVESITFDSKWSKSGIKPNEEGLLRYYFLIPLIAIPTC